MSRNESIIDNDTLEWFGQRELLDQAGKISVVEAKATAELEYACYWALVGAQPQRLDIDFGRAVKNVEKQSKPKNPRLRKT